MTDICKHSCGQYTTLTLTTQHLHLLHNTYTYYTTLTLTTQHLRALEMYETDTLNVRNHKTSEICVESTVKL